MRPVDRLIRIAGLIVVVLILLAGVGAIVERDVSLWLVCGFGYLEAWFVAWVLDPHPTSDRM